MSADHAPGLQAGSSEFYAPERVLIVVAHADDIEFGISGTVARWTDAGTQVTYCIVTDNGAGSNDPAVRRADLIETRRREQIESAAVVGVNDVRFLGYPDGTLQPTLDLRRDLTRLIRELRPQVVVTMDPTTVYIEEFGYINHPDHRAAGEAATYAVFPSAGTRPIFPELLDEGYEPHNVSKLYLTVAARPTLIVDISGVHDRKIAALRKHASQINDEAIAMVEQWDAVFGKAHGYAAAEIFRVIHLDMPFPQEAQEAVSVIRAGEA
jgi:LmbE family N-acetylglucosaminyl deacetylase